MSTHLLLSRSWGFFLGLFLCFVSIQNMGCVSARYSPAAVETVRKISTALPALMEKATAPYDNHKADVDALIAELDKAQSDAAAIKRNKEVAEQWRLLRDDVVKPYVNRWKEKGALSAALVKPAVESAKKSLASILRAEEGKRRAGN